MKICNKERLTISDAAATGRRDTLCLFPSIMTQEPKPFEQEDPIENTYMVNKRLFHTPGELKNECKSLKSREAVSKAFVLILNDGVPAT